MKRLILVLMFAMLTVPASLAQEEEAPVLSGEMKAYSDQANHFSCQVPVEFKDPSAPGSPVLTFEGPNYRGGALSFHVNAVHMPGVDSSTMHNINKGQTEKDPFYVEITPVKIPGGVGYMFKEADTDRGGAAKTPEAIHRWHLAAFGNGYYYNCTFGGSFSSFDDPVVTKAFQDIIKSFKIQ